MVAGEHCQVLVVLFANGYLEPHLEADTRVDTKERTSYIKDLEPPLESWYLKTGGLEIPDLCYTHPNPSIAGSSDS